MDIQLAPAGEHTELTPHQWPLPTLDELMSPTGRRDGKHTMHTFWPLAIGNLAAHLAGEPPLRCDFSPPRPAEIRVSLTIAAPADAVWRSLTDPSEVERWWGYAPEIEPRVGGKVTFGAEGEVSEWDPNRVFACTGDGMTTRWELSESDGVTTLTFTQSGFAPEERDNAAQHEAGWCGGLLEPRRMHELGERWTPSRASRKTDGQARRTTGTACGQLGSPGSAVSVVRRRLVIGGRRPPIPAGGQHTGVVGQIRSGTHGTCTPLPKTPPRDGSPHAPPTVAAEHESPRSPCVQPLRL